jgi:phosphoglycolate phosphatase
MFENRVYDGIPACLDALRQAGHELFVVTTKPTVFAARILEHFALTEYFRAVHGSELDGTHAAKSDLIAHVLRAERLDAAAAVMIGDRRHDIEGALANGVRACGVAWGFGSRAELLAAGAEVLANDPGDLVRLFGSGAAPGGVEGSTRRARTRRSPV